jgi:ubiquitin C
MQIIVRQIQGQSFELNVSPLDTIGEIKTKIQRLHDFPVDKQRLISKGKQLEDNKTIGDYEITDGLIIYMIVRTMLTMHKEVPKLPQKIDGFYPVGTNLHHIKSGIVVTAVHGVGAGYPRVMLPNGNFQEFDDFDGFEIF